MKVLMLNGSPRKEGNTALALREMQTIFEKEGIETEVICLGTQPIRGCIACNQCKSIGKCVFNDLVNEVAKKFEKSDGLVLASPVYFASANGSLFSFAQRLFYSTLFDKRMKVGAGLAIARRGGASATYDDLNKFFGVSGMPIATSQYWNLAHGKLEGEVLKDEEGCQTMRTLASNMSFLIKAIALGKEAFGLPEKESPTPTNFIR